MHAQLLSKPQRKPLLSFIFSSPFSGSSPLPRLFSFFHILVLCGPTNRRPRAGRTFLKKKKKKKKKRKKKKKKIKKKGFFVGYFFNSEFIALQVGYRWKALSEASTTRYYLYHLEVTQESYSKNIPNFAKNPR